MPFSEDFNNPWLFAIKPAAERCGLLAYRADDESRPMGKITRDITRSIIDADVIVAEMTGLSPNVTYELGLSHAAKKRVIMITQNTSEIPFDIHDIRHISYNINQLGLLKESLERKIQIMLDTPEGGDHDFFPELKIMTHKEREEVGRLKKENADLASLAYSIRITTTPRFAYVFFNNSYVGISPQTIHVNPYNKDNIVTVFAIFHFEEYRIIEEEDLTRKRLHFNLVRRDNDRFPERVHNWLKYIRKQPNDVVIGRAIATYLAHIGEHEEAVKQLKDLLGTCSNWSMLYNGIATSLVALGRAEESIDYFLKVRDLEDSYISYYNLACVYSILEWYDECLESIGELVRRDDFVGETVDIWGDDSGFDLELDFRNIKEDPVYASRFWGLVDEYKSKASKYMK